jgi:hypothetical protein
MAEECIGMNEDQQKRNYLDEHLPYMLKMLRYTYGQMLQKQHYLSWNAHFESFAVHARNLVKFLTNSDARNFKAHRFVQDYKARVGDIQGAMAKLEQQVFHLGKHRPPTFVGKFNTEHAQEVRDWIEKNFDTFVNGLDDDLRPLFNDKKADPIQDDPLYITVAANRSACTATVSSSSGGDTSVTKINR